MARSVTRWTPHTRAWEAEANRQARGYAPMVVPCQRCGFPNVSGYQCPHCGGGIKAEERQVRKARKLKARA